MISKSLTLLPEWIAPSSWWQHVPLAHWLICEIKPETVVELGTHYGVSYFAFCEAADAFSSQSFIYAVDTWEGDPHAGQYENEVYEKVQQHANLRHKLRARLIRSTFDEAAKYFDDKSIDLLHIDGLHTYEAVKHDYDTWLPKMKDESIIIFHDINVREREFGVWKLWAEIKENNTTHEIANGHGLGILVRGAKLITQMEELPEIIPALKSKGALLEMMAEKSEEGRFDSQHIRQKREELVTENKNLKDQLNKADDLLKELRNSTIWKLSEPLRKLNDRAKGKNHK